MTKRRLVGWLIVGAIVAALGLRWSEDPPQPQVEHPTSYGEPLIAEGVRLETYRVDGARRAVVRAARGYASRKRLRFLQTALVPTIRLEDVQLERYGPDGTSTAREQLSTVILDPITRILTAPAGSPLPLD